MPVRPIRTSAAAILLGLAVLAGGCAKQPAALEKATRLPEPRPLPEFSLTAASGDAFGRAELAGRWTLVFFGFANCPDVCPITLQQLAAARAELPADERPDILFVSVDPERDTPAVLADYAARFGPGVTAVTGSEAELRKLAGGIGIFYDVDPAAADGYAVSHSAAVLLIDQSASVHAIFSAPHSVPAFVNDLSRLVSPT